MYWWELFYWIQSRNNGRFRHHYVKRRRKKNVVLKCNDFHHKCENEKLRQSVAVIANEKWHFHFWCVCVCFSWCAQEWEREWTNLIHILVQKVSQFLMNFRVFVWFAHLKQCAQEVYSIHGAWCKKRKRMKTTTKRHTTNSILIWLFRRCNFKKSREENHIPLVLSLFVIAVA